MTIRKPAVAGFFYPDKPELLHADVRKFLSIKGDAGTVRPKAIVLPHAGYQYSGHVAGATLAQVELGTSFVILGPNHTGLGSPLSIHLGETWRTPLGDVAIDYELGESLKRSFPDLVDDNLAHLREHSIEVEVPFLQLAAPGMSFVPICLGHLSYDVCAGLGEAIASSIKEKTQIVASSDFNHFEGQRTTERKDQMAIEKILKLDPEGLYKIVHEQRISMCGVIPVTVALVAARALGATTARLVRHATSGDVTGEYESVVGYAGLLIF